MIVPSTPTPRVTVVVPVYGTAQYVAETLDSVLKQTYRNYEIIVVNDGSPDSQMLEEVLKPYHGRITYIAQKNRGLAAARNTALKLARGTYVAMLDSDDRWHPEYLESQVGLLESNPSLDVVYSDAALFGLGKGRYSDRYPVGGEITLARVLSRDCQIFGGVTARRETLLRVGMYDEEFRSAEDYDLWLRVLHSGGRIAFNDRALVDYRIREGSHTSTGDGLVRNVLRVLDKISSEKLTTGEREALDRQRTRVTAKLNLVEAKQALANGDTETAILKLRAAAAHRRGWKLRAVIACLRISPRIVRWFQNVRGG